MSSIVSPALQQGSGDIEGELRTLYDMADAYHADMEGSRQWRKCRAAYAGDLYGAEFLEQKMPRWKATGVHPKVHEVVESFASTLTDAEPKFAPKGRQDAADPLARIMLEASSYEWERQRMQTKMEVMARALLIDGSTWLYTGIDPLRGLFTKNLSPYAVRIDPAAENDLDLNYAVVNTTMSRGEIEAYFPHDAQEIFDTVTPSTRDDRPEEFRPRAPDRSGAPILGDLVNGTVAQATEIVGPQKRTSDRYTDRYRVREFWFTEGGERDFEIALSDGSEERLQMPGTKGRRIVVIEEHYFPGLDTDNPYDHGQIPLSRFNAVTTLGEYYGHSYILPLIDTARQIADLDNQILNNIRLMLNPIWLVPFESRVNPNKFYGMPNMVIPYRAPHKPEAHVSPPLPDYVFRQRMNKQQEFDVASGLSDLSRGIIEGGLENVSGKAVSLLRQPEQRRMRPIQRAIEDSLPRWGYQTLVNACQTWPGRRWMDVLPDDLKPAVQHFPWLRPEWQGPVDEWVPELRMEVGSNLPPDQQAKASLAINLYDKAAFGPPGSPVAVMELLKGVDWPGAKEVVARLQAFQQGNPHTPDPVEQTKALSAFITALAAWSKDGNPIPLGVVDAVLEKLGEPDWTAPAPPSVGGQDKALGGMRSPASDLAVMQNPNGQEVRHGT